MTFYAVQYRYRSDADVAAVRPTHREYLRDLADQGQLKASGPYVDAEYYDALLIFEADSADAVQALVEADPMATEGVLESSAILEWNPLIGVFAE